MTTKKEGLQETALQLDLEIDGLTIAQLEQAIEARRVAQADEVVDAIEVAPEPVPEPASRVVDARDPQPKLLNGYNVTDADRELARQYNYPVNIPNGAPYRTRVSFNCAFGGGLRQAGSIVILNPAHAAHKSEFITEV